MFEGVVFRGLRLFGRVEVDCRGSGWRGTICSDIASD